MLVEDNMMEVLHKLKWEIQRVWLTFKWWGTVHEEGGLLSEVLPNSHFMRQKLEFHLWEFTNYSPKYSTRKSFKICQLKHFLVLSLCLYLNIKSVRDYNFSHSGRFMVWSPAGAQVKWNCCLGAVHSFPISPDLSKETHFDLNCWVG